MKKFITWFVIVIILLSGLTGFRHTEPAISASSCTITTSSATVGNGTLSYSQVGSGRSILLLHGLFATKEQWNSIMCRLSEAGYRAIAPDLPGYGSSTGFAVRDYALEN